MKVAYFILGMHRSGTSALSSVLESIGVEFGDSLMSPTEDNPKGYYENTAVQAFNETLLTNRGFGWDDICFDVLSLDEASLDDLVSHAIQIIKREFGCFTEFGVKDPRLCILFPIWQRACAALGIEVKVILAYRNPYEVASSLKMRNQMSYQQGFALWCEYMAKAEKFSRQNTRILVSYDDLINQLADTTKVLAEFSGNKIPTFTESESPIDPALRHHTNKSDANLALPEFIEAFNYEFQQKKLNIKAIDAAAEKFDNLKPFFCNQSKAQLLSHVLSDRRKYKLIKDDYLNKLNKNRSELEDRTSSLRELENKNTRYREERNEFSVHIAKKDLLIQDEVTTNQELQRSQQSLDHKLQLLEIDLKSTEHRLQQVEKDKVYLANAYDKAEVKIEELSKSKATVERAHHELVQNNASQKEVNNKFQQSLEHKAQVLEIDLKNTEYRLQQVEKDKLDLANAYDKAEVKIEELRKTELDLVAINKQFEQDIQDLENKVSELTRALYQAKQSVVSAQGVTEGENQKLLAEFQRDKKIIKDQLKSQWKAEIKEKSDIIDVLKQQKIAVEASYEAWLSLNIKPVSKLATSELFNADKVNPLNILSTVKFARQAQVAISKATKYLAQSQYIPLNFVANFDDSGYLAANEDVEVAVEMRELENGLEHFLQHGFTEVFEGKRKIHLKRRFYSKPKGDEADALDNFSHFLKNFYTDPALHKSKEEASQIIPVVETIDYSRSESKGISTQIPPAIGLPLKQWRPQPNYLSALDLTVVPAIDIILPVYNALDDVEACIKSLYDLETVPFNLIVIDDCSNEETKVWLERQQTIRGFTLLRNAENKRFTKTVNLGFSVCKGDYVVLLNSDTIVTSYWLEKILLCFQQDKSTGIVGPLSNAASWQTVPVREDKMNGGWLVNDIPDGFSIELMGQLVETVSTRQYPLVPSVNGFCYVIKRDVIEKIGTLDEEYFPTGYGEEDDFSIRARKSGFNIRVVDDTYVFHAKSKSYTKEVRKVLTVGGRKSLDKKHGKEEIENLIAAWKAEPALPQIGAVIESFMHLSDGNKKVVYTAIFGGYDNLKTPEYINSDWDYVCFTDNPNLKSDVFTIKQVNPLFDNVTKNARMIKLLSHLFLIGYEYSLWIDGSVKLRGRNINELIDVNLSNKYISLHQHVKRSCVYEEEEACSLSKKDDSEILATQVEFYRQQGMPEDVGLFETAEIARIHNATEVHQLNSHWWQQLDKFSIRDQISLPYVFWQHSYENHFMQGNQWIDGYFHMYKHEQTLSHEKTFVHVVVPIVEPFSNVSNIVSQILDKTNYKHYSITLLIPEGHETIDVMADIMVDSKIKVDYKVYSNELTSKKLNNFIKALKAEMICLLMPSVTLFNSDWLSMLVSGFDIDPTITVTGPTVLSPDYEFVASSLRLKRSNGEVIDIKNSRKLGGTGSVASLHDCCFMLTKQSFISQGGFNETLNDLRSAVIEYCDRNLKNQNKNFLILHAEVIANEDNETLADKTLLLNILNSKKR